MNLRIRYNHWYPKLIGAEAIVLYPFVLFASKAKDVPPQTWRHEMTHVDQVRRVGWFSFYISYLLFYFAFRLSGEDHYTAYLKIPWEVEAREA